MISGLKKVLFVDSHRDVAFALCDLVRAFGHVAGAAFNRDGAIIVAQMLRPEIVVLDVAPPDEDGYAIVRAIRSQPGLEDCRIVAVSANPSGEHPAQSLRAGCESHHASP